MTVVAFAPAQAPELDPLLGEVEAFYRRFLATLSDDHFAILAAWTAHTYVCDLAYATPYLHVTSAERGSGKSRLLEVANLLTYRPALTVNVSGAALFRELDSGDVVTLLLDEVDNFLNAGKIESESRRDVLAILNAGYTRGATAARVLGAGTKGEMVRRYAVFGPKVLTGLGELPDTLANRSLRFGMKKRTREEQVERFRARYAAPEGRALRDRLEAWAQDEHVREALTVAEPALPDELEDRMMDAAEQLVAIADLAGGAWPERVRAAVVTVAREGASASEASRGMRLLADLRSVVADVARDRYSMAELVSALNAIEEAEWGGWHQGTGLKARDLGKLLKPYGIKSQTVPIDGGRPKGYYADRLADAFGRYLPAASGDAEAAEVTEANLSARSPFVPDEPQTRIDIGIPEGDRGDRTNPPVGEADE